MLDPIILDAPLFWPNKCQHCDNYKGPVLDLHKETSNRERIYVCQRCVTYHAQLFGLLPGDEHERLLRSDAILRERDRELAKATNTIAKDAKVKKEQRVQISELQDYRAWAEGRLAQLEAAIGEDAKARLALVEH